MSDDTLRVLVLDRDLGARTMCAQIVAMLGHEIAEVGDGEVALDVLCSQPHRVLIVDWDSLEQPRWTQLGRLLTARPGLAPACVLTCTADAEAELRASAAGAVLIKPVAPDLLMQAVGDAIDGPAPAREPARPEPEPALEPVVESGPVVEGDPIVGGDAVIADDAPSDADLQAFGDDLATGEMVPTITSEPVIAADRALEEEPDPDTGPLFVSEPALETSPMLALEPGPDARAIDPTDGDDETDGGEPGARPEGTASDAIALVEDDEEGWGGESTDVSRDEPTRPGDDVIAPAAGEGAAEPAAGLAGPDTNEGAQPPGDDPERVVDQGEAGEPTWEAEERDPASTTLEEGEDGLLTHEFIITSGFASEHADDASERSDEGRSSSEYIRTAGSVTPEDGAPATGRRPTPPPDDASAEAPPPPASRHRGPIFRIPVATPAEGVTRPSSAPLEAPAPEPRPQPPEAPQPEAAPPPPLEEVEQVAPGFPSRGELAEHPFVKLIVTAMRHKLTGTLAVTRRGLCQEFHFDGGKPVGLSIDNPAGGLIPWLFGQDLISDADSDAALDEALETGADQASIIFRRQLLDPVALVSAMGDHFTALCTETIGFADGTFSFREGKPALKSPPLSGVSLPKIVVQGMLEYAQAGHIIQLLDLPVQAVPIPVKGAAISAQDIPLPTLEARTRDLAMRSASMREILDSSHLEPIKTQALVRALYVLGTIDIDPTGQSAPTRPAAAPRQAPARTTEPPPPTPRPSAPPPRPTPTSSPAPPADAAAPKVAPATAPSRPSAPPPGAPRPSRPNVIDYVHSDREINVKAEMRQILKDYAEAERAQQVKPVGILSRLLSDSPDREDWKDSVKRMMRQQKDEGGGGKGLLGKLFKKGS